MRTHAAPQVSPFALLARKEILDHLLSLRFHACLLIMTGLLALSTLVMYSDFKLRAENYAVLHERARYRPGESGLMAVVPPRPLSIFAKGLDEIMGRGYTITAYLGIEAHTRQKRAESLRVQEFAKNRFLSIRSAGQDPAGSIEAFNHSYDRVVEAHRAKLDSLTRTTLRLSRFSPAATLSYVLTDLAGTGLTEHRRLGRALTDYKNAALPFLDSLLSAGGGSLQPPPEFVLSQLPMRAVFRPRLILDLVIMSFSTAAMMIAAVTVFSKSDPR